MPDDRILDFQSRLAQRYAEQADTAARLDRGLAICGILARAVAEIGATGADNAEIAAHLQVAADEIEAAAS